jgi:signal transduction histidine kinase
VIPESEDTGPAVGQNGSVINIPSREQLREAARQSVRPTGRLPRPVRRSQVFDAVLALVLCVFATIAASRPGVAPDLQMVDGHLTAIRPTGPGSLLSAPVVALLSTLPLVLRRRYPLAVLWTVMAATMLGVDNAPRGAFYAGVVAAYSAAAYSPFRAATLASLPVVAFLVGLFRKSQDYSVPDKYLPFLVLVPIVVAADTIRSWKRRSDDNRDRLMALEHAQVQELRHAVEHERARIARELHDVVTHNVSVMVIQAGAARRVMDIAPDQAKEALLAVEAGGRAAMAELRHVMGLLTMDSDEAERAGADPAAGADLAPQPGMDRLEALVARVRDTGVPVELSVTGEPRTLPSGVELAAYRVVQEALTNMVKHAVGATATVAVDYAADRLRVEVTDTGGSPSPSAAAGNGRGLIGLRERLAVYGGALQTGHRPSGGYRVSALIPLETP